MLIAYCGEDIVSVVKNDQAINSNQSVYIIITIYYNSKMSFEKLEVFGNTPLPRFGHSITLYAQNKVCLFGGATGNTGQFSITDNTYTLDLTTRFWKKVETTGTSPSARAAHGAVCVEANKIVIYGGATGSGGLASDDLFHLDIREAVGIWNVINVKDRTPGKRYGHTLSYSKPYLIVFGGNIGDKSVNDCWILNITKPPLSWAEVKCEGQAPGARVYHSAALCTSGTAGGMVVIFGGRGLDNNPLCDSWGLRRHRTGRWDWVRAPQKSNPSPRYQHSSLFVGPLMMVIGGRTNSVNQKLPLEVFNTETSEWTSFESIQRFRHGCWLQDKNLLIYGGFQLSTPNIPTDSIFRVSLINLFNVSASLTAKLKTLDSELLSTSGSQSQNNSKQMEDSSLNRAPNTPNIRGGSSSQGVRSRQQVKPTSQKKKRVKLLEPVIGNQKNKPPVADLKRKNLNSKLDIASYFLDVLMQPAAYSNAEALKISFKADQIIALCNVAEEIIVSQPMILQAKPPLKIFGDIHGQFTDLMSFFNLFGCPHKNSKKEDIENFDYIFLGDFVDRGSHSLETICLLLALKCLYPEQIHLIRGNHEDSQININFGFRDECAEKIQEEPEDEKSVFMRINRLFDWLPLAALVEDKILCLHGGIGASLNTLEDIENIKRPLEVMHEVQDEQSQIVLDILWSDPTESDSQLGIYPNHLRDPSQTGNIVKFGPDRVKSFLAKNNLSMIIRAHQCVMDGIERFAGGALITVFSATDYCRKHKNAGAILIVKSNYEIVPKMIYPSSSNANNWIEDDQQLKKRPPTPPRWKNQRNY